MTITTTKSTGKQETLGQQSCPLPREIRKQADEFERSAVSETSFHYAEKERNIIVQEKDFAFSHGILE